MKGLLLFLLAPAVFAQPSIVPSGECGAVTLHVMASAQTIPAERVADAYLFEPHHRTAVVPDGASADFAAEVPKDGLLMASVNLKPRVHGNETRTEHAKAFVFCGAKTPIADWQLASGLGLEIVPQSWNGARPQMKAGDTMRFIAIDQSTRKLLGDLPMELYRAGGEQLAEGTPAQSGGMNFPYPEPGRYMVVATYRRPDPQQEEHWLVDTTTLTFDVR